MSMRDELDQLPHEPHDRRAHARLDHLEKALAKQMENQEEMERAIRKNTELTQKIVDNTAEMVQLFKGAKALRGFVLWATPLVAAAIAVAAWFKAH